MYEVILSRVLGKLHALREHHSILTTPLKLLNACSNQSKLVNFLAHFSSTFKMPMRLWIPQLSSSTQDITLVETSVKLLESNLNKRCDIGDSERQISDTWCAKQVRYEGLWSHPTFLVFRGFYLLAQEEWKNTHVWGRRRTAMWCFLDEREISWSTNECGLYSNLQAFGTEVHDYKFENAYCDEIWFRKVAIWKKKITI